jgi:hypothetical protein
MSDYFKYNQKGQRDKWRAEGKCWRCGRERAFLNTQCQQCSDTTKKAMKRYAGKKRIKQLHDRAKFWSQKKAAA